MRHSSITAQHMQVTVPQYSTIKHYTTTMPHHPQDEVFDVLPQVQKGAHISSVEEYERVCITARNSKFYVLTSPSSTNKV